MNVFLEINIPCYSYLSKIIIFFSVDFLTKKKRKIVFAIYTRYEKLFSLDKNKI